MHSQQIPKWTGPFFFSWFRVFFVNSDSESSSLQLCFLSNVTECAKEWLLVSRLSVNFKAHSIHIFSFSLVASWKIVFWREKPIYKGYRDVEFFQILIFSVSKTNWGPRLVPFESLGSQLLNGTSLAFQLVLDAEEFRIWKNRISSSP